MKVNIVIITLLGLFPQLNSIISLRILNQKLHLLWKPFLRMTFFCKLILSKSPKKTYLKKKKIQQRLNSVPNLHCGILFYLIINVFNISFKDIIYNKPKQRHKQSNQFFSQINTKQVKINIGIYQIIHSPNKNFLMHFL